MFRSLEISKIFLVFCTPGIEPPIFCLSVQGCTTVPPLDFFDWRGQGEVYKRVDRDLSRLTILISNVTRAMLPEPSWVLVRSSMYVHTLLTSISAAAILYSTICSILSSKSNRNMLGIVFAAFISVEAQLKREQGHLGQYSASAKSLSPNSTWLSMRTRFSRLCPDHI